MKSILRKTEIKTCPLLKKRRGFLFYFVAINLPQTALKKWAKTGEVQAIFFYSEIEDWRTILTLLLAVTCEFQKFALWRLICCTIQLVKSGWFTIYTTRFLLPAGLGPVPPTKTPRNHAVLSWNPGFEKFSEYGTSRCRKNLSIILTSSPHLKNL